MDFGRVRCLGNSSKAIVINPLMFPATAVGNRAVLYSLQHVVNMFHHGNIVIYTDQHFIYYMLQQQMLPSASSGCAPQN